MVSGYRFVLFRSMYGQTICCFSCNIWKLPFQVAHNFIPHLLDAVLFDYQRNIPAAREPEVLSTMATVVQRLESHITTHVPSILDAVFECTLEMINKDMAEYPEHRTHFFTLLDAVNSKCFPAFLQLSQDKFKLVLDSVIWAIKHTMRQVRLRDRYVFIWINEIPLGNHQIYFTFNTLTF